MLKARLKLVGSTPFVAVAFCQSALAFTPPTIDNSVASGTARVAIVQVINSWALRTDQGNSTAASELFSPASQLSLYYNDTSSGQVKLTPTGYSPSATPAGGTAGGGCTAKGQASIANFFSGRAPIFGPAVTTKWSAYNYRTNVLNSLVSFSDGQDATARTYVVMFAGTPKQPLIYSGQLLTQLQFTSTAGWQITNMQIIFDTAQPTFPCQN